MSETVNGDVAFALLHEPALILCFSNSLVLLLIFLPPRLAAEKAVACARTIAGESALAEEAEDEEAVMEGGVGVGTQVGDYYFQSETFEL